MCARRLPSLDRNVEKFVSVRLGLRLRAEIFRVTLRLDLFWCGWGIATNVCNVVQYISSCFANYRQIDSLEHHEPKEVQALKRHQETYA